MWAYRQGERGDDVLERIEEQGVEVAGAESLVVVREWSVRWNARSWFGW